MSKGPIVANMMNNKLGGIVKTTRVRMNMTQSEFAELMHVPVSTLNNWESGINNPPEYFMDLLGVRFDEHLAKQRTNNENPSVFNMNDILSLNDVDNVPVSFIVTSMISMMEQFKLMNDKLSSICDILSYNFDDGSELESFDDDDSENVTDEDVFCLTNDEKSSGVLEDTDTYVDISLYLAARNMTDDELNSQYSPTVIRQLGRTVLTGNESSYNIDDCDEIDLSDCDINEEG